MSISTSCMLVTLSIGSWSGVKLDRKASDEVTNSNDAQSGSAKVNKVLLGNCKELHILQKYISHVRKEHLVMTLPWTDNGLRLLPMAQYMKYVDAMNELKTEFDRLVKNFLDAYAWEVNAAQIRLGKLFNATDYPLVETLAARFYFRTQFTPIPERGDWRIQAEQAEVQSLQERYERDMQESVQKAMADIWERARDVLTRMVDRLDYQDDATKKVFRDSLVSNVMDVVDIMRTCNITNDPEMERKAQALASALRGVSPEDLREDSALRLATRRAVENVLSSLPEL